MSIRMEINSRFERHVPGPDLRRTQGPRVCPVLRDMGNQPTIDRWFGLQIALRRSFRQSHACRGCRLTAHHFGIDRDSLELRHALRIARLVMIRAAGNRTQGRLWGVTCRTDPAASASRLNRERYCGIAHEIDGYYHKVDADDFIEIAGGSSCGPQARGEGEARQQVRSGARERGSSSAAPITPWRSLLL